MIDEATNPHDAQPNPALTPEQVIKLQVEALQENDIPYDDAGITLAFAFASPGNRALTGPLDRFTAMVKNSLYRDMLGCQTAEYGSLTILGDQAQQVVTLTTQEYQQVSYLFTVSRQQEPPVAGCWMTDGVVRLP